MLETPRPVAFTPIMRSRRTPDNQVCLLESEVDNSVILILILGFGTERQRVPKDSVNRFDSCSLSLQLARNPVVSKQGYLFDKEVILQYIITKKNEYNRKLKEYERQKTEDVKELEEIAAAENKKKLDKFTKTEKNINQTSKNA